MDIAHKKHTKSYGKRCPECDAQSLMKVIHKKIEDGVEYSEEYMECEECGYLKKSKSNINYSELEKYR